MKRWEGPHEYPSLDASLDNKSESFGYFYGKLQNLLHGPELGQGNASFGRGIDRFESETDAGIEKVLQEVDTMFGSKNEKGTTFKIELLQTFVEGLKRLSKEDPHNTCIYIALGCARAFLSGYISLEYESEDSRFRKTKERMISKEAKDIVYALEQVVRNVSEELRTEDNISLVAFEAMLKDELNKMYTKDIVNEGTMKEALRMFMNEALEMMNYQNTDPDGRWGAAFLAVESFCETHFPGMIVE
jgi:hypothetical protein